MGFHHDAGAPLGGIGKYVGELDLSARMEMDFWFFEVNKLSHSGGPQCYQHRQRLRYAEAYVGDTNHVVRVVFSAINK
jgi:hypothetical protein